MQTLTQLAAAVTARRDACVVCVHHRWPGGACGQSAWCTHIRCAVWKGREEGEEGKEEEKEEEGGLRRQRGTCAIVENAAATRVCPVERKSKPAAGRLGRAEPGAVLGRGHQRRRLPVSACKSYKATYPSHPGAGVAAEATNNRCVAKLALRSADALSVSIVRRHKRHTWGQEHSPSSPPHTPLLHCTLLHGPPAAAVTENWPLMPNSVDWRRLRTSTT